MSKMRIFSLGIPLLGAAFAGLCAPARAAPLAFGIPGSTAAEAGIVNASYEGFLKEHPSARLQTAVVDLDGSGVGSIFVRFQDTSTCVGSSCHVTLLKFENDAWVEVFGHMAKSLETVPGTKTADGVAVQSIMIDGKEVWDWNGGGSYGPNLASVGVPFDVKHGKSPTSADQTIAANASVGALNGAGIVDMTQTQVDVGAPGGKALWIEVHGQGVCTTILGCPYAMLLPQQGAQRPVAFQGFAFGPGAVLPTVRNGLHDIALGMPEGYQSYTYNGKSYVPFYTSYPSPLTTSP